MFEGLLANVETYIGSNPWLAIVAVFLGGVTTAVYPCVLATIPLMMSFVAGSRQDGIGPARAFGYSLIFVLGLSITFTILGVTAAVAGTLFGDVSHLWRWIVAAVCVVMGLHLMGVLNFTFPVLVRSQPRTRGAVGAFVLGLLFGFVSIPCAAPILVVLLTAIAGAKASVAYGGLLLLVYALGHSVLIIVAGTSMGMARKLLESKRLTNTTAKLRQLSGAVILIIGVYIALTGGK